MLIVQNRRFKKQHVIGGSGIFDSIIKFLIKAFVATDRPCGDGCGIATAFVVEETGAGWVVLKVTVAIRGRSTTYGKSSCSDSKDSSTLSMLTAQNSTEDSSCK